MGVFFSTHVRSLYLLKNTHKTKLKSLRNWSANVLIITSVRVVLIIAKYNGKLKGFKL